MSFNNLRFAAMLVGLAISQPAFATPGDIVISQFYGGGSSTSAYSEHDFVELFNRSASPVDISGWSVQYTVTGTGTVFSKIDIPLATPLIPAGGYFLIKIDLTITPVGPDLPCADLTFGPTSSNPSTAATVAVVKNTTLLANTNCPIDYLVVSDWVRFNTAAGPGICSENNTLTGGTGAILSKKRKLNGCQDTDDNAADFDAAATPTPRCTSSSLNPCGGSSVTDWSIY